MVYKVLLHPKANAFLDTVEDQLRSRMREGLLALGADPRKGTRLKHSDYWRLRIGEYRAIYEIDHVARTVIVLFLGHRKVVYDDFSRLL